MGYTKMKAIATRYGIRDIWNVTLGTGHLIPAYSTVIKSLISSNFFVPIPGTSMISSIILK